MARKTCASCQAAFDHGFHADCGEDCLLCQAYVHRDPEAQKEILALTADFVPRMLYFLRWVEALRRAPEPIRDDAHGLLKQMGARLWETK